MKYQEEHRDLFTVPENYFLAHCISSDFGMGAGIVVEFNRRFQMKSILMAKYKDEMVKAWEDASEWDRGFCLLEGRVFNLVTKQYVYEKPTYQTLRTALCKMRDMAVERGIKCIAMPLIGCGIDKLSWDEVSSIIMDVFCETEIEILVCRKD